MNNYVDGSQKREVQATRPARRLQSARQRTLESCLSNHISDDSRPSPHLVLFLKQPLHLDRPSAQFCALRTPRCLGHVISPSPFLPSSLPYKNWYISFYNSIFLKKCIFIYCGNGVYIPPDFEPLVSVAWSFAFCVLPMPAVVRAAGHAFFFGLALVTVMLASSLAMCSPALLILLMDAFSFYFTNISKMLSILLIFSNKKGFAFIDVFFSYFNFTDLCFLEFLLLVIWV